MSLVRMLKSMHRFFFDEVDTWGLSLFRIAIGLVCLNKIIFLYPELTYWYTDLGIVDLGASLQPYTGPRLNLFKSLKNFDSYGVAISLWSIALVSATTFTLGLYTKISTVILYVTLISFDHRNTYVLQGADALIRVLLFWMLFAQSNAYMSVDNIIARAKSKTIPALKSAWPFRAMQIQVCLMYLGTFLHKSEGQTWWNGEAVYIVSQLIEFKRYPLPLLYTSWTLLKLATWMTLIFEGVFALLVWFRETRLWILGFGMIFHLSLEWHLNIPLFQIASMACYALFLEKEDFQHIQNFIQTKLFKPKDIGKSKASV